MAARSFLINGVEAVFFQQVERASGFDLEKFESVFPREFAKHSGLGVLLEYRQRFAGYALAAHPRRRRIVILTDASAAPVLTGTIAAKDEFVLMTLQKIRRERRIARQSVVAGIRR